MIDHDRLFKELLSTFFLEFVELFLPTVECYLERNSLVFLDKELFTDMTEGERYEADLVVQAKFRGQDSFFLIHTEHQAKSQKNFAQRMFRYFARLHEKHGLPIYPVVIFSHDAPQKAEPSSYQVAFPDQVILEFNYTVIQLNRLNWRDFVQQANPVASALMAKMQIAPPDRPRVNVQCLRLLATLRLDPARMQLISGFIDTYLHLNAEDEARFRAELATIEPEAQEVVMQIVTSWMQEGLQQGRQEEAIILIMRQLTRRIGVVESELQEQIRRLSITQLEALSESLLDFSAPADLVTWLYAQET